MTVYVDPIQDYPEALDRGLPGRLWCHMTATTKPELHQAARRIGLQWSWFQHGDDYRWHYDLTPHKRALAVRHGAEEVDRAVFVRIVAERRPRPAAGAPRPAATARPGVPGPALAPAPKRPPGMDSLDVPDAPLISWNSSAHWDYQDAPGSCHLCGGPTHLLDDAGRHAHKTCVEAWYASHPEAYAAYLRTHPAKGAKKGKGKGKSATAADTSQDGLWDH